MDYERERPNGQEEVTTPEPEPESDVEESAAEESAAPDESESSAKSE